jgi:hypothetical protein
MDASHSLKNRICLIHSTAQVVSKLLVQQRKEEREREDKDKDKVPISSVISANTESSASAPLPKSKHHGRARQVTPPPCAEPCRSTSSSPVIANEVRVRASQVFCETRFDRCFALQIAVQLRGADLRPGP